MNLVEGPGKLADEMISVGKSEVNSTNLFSTMENVYQSQNSFFHFLHKEAIFSPLVLDRPYSQSQQTLWRKSECILRCSIQFGGRNLLNFVIFRTEICTMKTENVDLHSYQQMLPPFISLLSYIFFGMSWSIFHIQSPSIIECRWTSLICVVIVVHLNTLEDRYYHTPLFTLFPSLDKAFALLIIAINNPTSSLIQRAFLSATRAPSYRHIS